MSTLTKQAKQLSIPLAAALALGCVLLYLLVLKMPQPSYDGRSSSAPVMSPQSPNKGPHPEIARSSIPSQHVAPRTPELPKASSPERPTRFVLTGDRSSPTAKMLVRFLVEGQVTDAQQQLFFGLLWDAKMEYDLLVDVERGLMRDPNVDVVNAAVAMFPDVYGDYYEQTDAEINRQMREVLTPEQWELYEANIRNIPANLAKYVGPDPGEERR
jgi:ABC-type uncharacterized transport system involved in gliding motility auxiliary subunit